MITTAFNPVQHGFKFRNNFVNHVISVPSLGIDFTTLGRCGGMAFAALDYWHHHLAIPEDSSLPAEGTLVSTYIYDRLINSIVANAFKFFHFMRTPDHPTFLNGIGVARATREEEFPKLQRLINQGQPCALGLTKARDVGGFKDDHQVVAYGYELGDPYSTVLIYDNRDPNKEHRLTFKTTYDHAEREIRHSDGGVWRGFFVESYNPQVPFFLANGSLLSEFSQDAIYVVRGGGRFWIPSPSEFEANGFSWNAVLETTDGSLSHVSTYPANGTLIRERDAAAVYIVYGGVPFHIPSPEIFDTLGFNWQSILTIPAGSMGDLSKFPASGTLLREWSSPEVYLAENQVLRHIPNQQEFDALGLSWSNVGVVPDGGLGALSKGNPLPTTSPTPTPIPRSWAENPSGSILTADGDKISYVIQPNALGTDVVEFILRLGAGLTWRKELVLSANNGQRTAYVVDNRREDSGKLDRHQLPNGRLLFRKAKEFGIVRDIHSLVNLDQLASGARVIFVWDKD